MQSASSSRCHRTSTHAISADTYSSSIQTRFSIQITPQSGTRAWSIRDSILIEFAYVRVEVRVVIRVGAGFCIISKREVQRLSGLFRLIAVFDRIADQSQTTMFESWLVHSSNCAAAAYRFVRVAAGMAPRICVTGWAAPSQSGDTSHRTWHSGHPSLHGLDDWVNQYCMKRLSAGDGRPTQGRGPTFRESCMPAVNLEATCP